MRLCRPSFLSYEKSLFLSELNSLLDSDDAFVELEGNAPARICHDDFKRQQMFLVIVLLLVMNIALADIGMFSCSSTSHSTGKTHRVE
jgi:hypothetical protein